MAYAYGEPVTLTLTGASGTANLADYAEVVLTIIQPDGTSLTRTKTGGTLATNPYVFTPAQAGRHAYYYVTTTPNGATTPQPFDVDPAGTAGLVSLSDAKTVLNMTSTANDDELQGVIDAASALLLNHPDYTVRDHTRLTTYTQWAPAAGPTIILDHYPVASVTSVTEYIPTAQVIAAEPLATTSTFTGYGYTLDNATGILTRTSGGTETNWQGRVQVVYSAGVTIVPADIRQAALELVTHLWETQRGTQLPNLPGGLDLDNTAPDLTGSTYALPNRVAEQLIAYRRTPAIA